MKPRLAITMGDVNGIGPEILVKALSRDEIWSWCEPIVVGAEGVLETLRAEGLPCPQRGDRRFSVLDGDVEAPRRVAGVVDAEAGRCAVEWLRLAVRMAIAVEVAGIVTCPISKEAVHLSGEAALGHTEIIAQMTNSPSYRMCLFSDRMRIVHVTAHVPLAEAIRQLTTERVEESIEIANEALKRLDLPERRIAVAGLNPHAGEAGLIGAEEAAIIAPAVRACSARGIDCSGPYPPDTVFRRMHEGEFELVIAMYHDQGHIPLKLVAMDEGVNVTLGIPIVRTSVDHGTAFDIAGKGVAREDSLLAAVHLAAQLAASQTSSARA